jgi:DNA-binding MarR family transcriptional regulator
MTDETLDTTLAAGGRELPRDLAAGGSRHLGDDLDDKLAAALERTSQALRVLLWDQAKRHGLSPIQVQLVLRLAGEPAERRRVGVLARELDVTAPTVSDAIAALKGKRLVRAGAAPGDRRGLQLQLTGRGRTLASRLATWQDVLTQELRGLPDADKASTLGVLLELIGALQRQGVVTVARMCTTCRFFARDAHPGRPLRHHCRLLDAPLGEAELRVDCAEHEPGGVLDSAA